ncbi:Metallo-dependent hydrolase [Meredithblackwellia eburnea MCA 4105]
MAAIKQLFLGTIVTSKQDRSLSILYDHLLGVDTDGFVRHLEDSKSIKSLELLGKAETDWSMNLERLDEFDYILPGFIDTHSADNSFHCCFPIRFDPIMYALGLRTVHAPQYLNAGTALDKPLMEWLEHYTFKSESRIDADPSGLGARVYEKLVARMIESGTTAASVFGTLTVEANLYLARAFQSGGIRAQIGAVAMDLNGIDSYIETTAASLHKMTAFIHEMNQLVLPLEPHRRLVEPVITPRFVPTCSKELLVGLSKLAKDTGVRIQSHMSEAVDQVEWSKSMWGGTPDFETFDSLGLLTPKTLMAHCTHMDIPTFSLLTKRGVSIAHCPLSNVYFSSEQPLRLREALTAGVKVGLGSDISGGYRLALDNSMRWAVGVSRLRAGAQTAEEKGKQSHAITWKESLYVATLGGALALGLDDRCGTLEVGKAFDAQLIKVGGSESELDLFDENMDREEVLEKWWCNGTRGDRKGVWVQGVRLRSVE